jgi:hypothetical protein
VVKLDTILLTSNHGLHFKTTALMKYLLTLLLAALLIHPAIAQKKPAKKETVPSQKELDEMMKEMQNSLDEMSPEDKKMMDSLGFKMPNVNNMKKMAGFAMANSAPISETIVPVRDPLRIAAIPKTALTKASVQEYVQTLNKKINGGFSAETISKTNKLYDAVKAKHNNVNAVANTAAGLWVFGKPLPALILMGRLCAENPSAADHLNNYAAMVSMSGGEQVALPILQFLNRQYPKNSTILNNIGHAWFGLGDLQKASLYIDSTLKLCAWHPQANQIKAAIEESKGNIPGAIQALRNGISKMHSSDKEQKLLDLGYDLKPGDYDWNPPRKGDGLGLSKFNWPEFPKTADASERVKKNWLDFQNECSRIGEQLNAELNQLHAANQKLQQEKMAVLSSGNTAKYASVITPISPKAIKKLQPRVEELILLEGTDPLYQQVDKLRAQVAEYADWESKELRDLEKAFKGKMGEGYGIPSEYCQALDGIRDRFLKNANSAVENFCKKMSARAYMRINEIAHFNLYRFSGVELAFHNQLLKIEWLGLMSMAAELVNFRDEASYCSKKEEKKRNPGTAIPDFDELNCSYKSNLNLVFGSIRTECGKTFAEIEIDFVKLGWETKSSDLEENRNFLEEFQRCTIEVSAGKGKSFGEGPLQLQTSVGATGFVEIDRSGIKDAGVKVGADVSVGTNVLDTKVETDFGEVNVGPKEPSVSVGGVNATISINSGFTATGSGILKGVKL